jgi:glycosyltransferase involved in cell wall biosynthesis
MRILFLTELFYPHGSGAELATFLYGRLLGEEAIDVKVLTNRFPGEPFFSEEGSLQVYRLPLFGEPTSMKYSIFKRLDVMASSFFNKLLSWADVVYVPRFWFTAIAWAKARGKPVVVHMHDYISVCSLSTLFDETKSQICSKGGIACSPKCLYSFEKAHGRNFGQTLSSMVLNSTVGRYLPKLMMLADAVICVSSKQKELIIDRGSPFRGKTHVIYNPFPKYSDNEIEGEDFGYFGGPDVLKGFNVLVNAVSQINRTKLGSPRIQCTKFGSLREDFVRRLEQIGFSLHRKLEVTELEQLYRKVKAVLVPSIWNEPWPYVVVEALIRGRFVIASKIGGMPEQLEGCKGSILFGPGDTNALTESIEEVGNMAKDEIVDLGCRNRGTFLSRFNNDSSIKKFISICENLT